MDGMLVGVDPGSVFGGLVSVEVIRGRPCHVVLPLGPRPLMREIVRWIGLPGASEAHRPGLVIELASGGRLLSRDLLATIFWSGRLVQAALAAGWRVRGYSRPAIKSALLGRATYGDRHVRAWLIDAWGSHPQSRCDAREPAIGSRRAPGPLYGVTRDAWSALAVCHASLMSDPSEEFS